MYHSSRPAARTRAATLWLAVTATVLVLGRLAVAAVGDAASGGATFADLLVASCGVLAALAAARLWLATTAVVVEVLGSVPHVRPGSGPLRRTLLAACGIAVLSAGASPAAGEHGPGGPTVGVRSEHPLDGLPLPDRATGGDGSRTVVRPEPPRPHPRRATVRVGDSLWAIAGFVLGPGATHAEISAYWPTIHRANSAVIGDDPDLIHPGQRLDLPPRSRPRGGPA